MKKIALLFFALLSISSFAQTEKGKFYLGARSNFNFNSSSTEIKSGSNTATNQNKHTQFSLNIQAGYLLINNLVTGLDLGYSSIKPKDIDATNTFTIAPFVKYYFLKNNFKPFINASYGFGSIKSNFTSIFQGGFGVRTTEVTTDINKLNFGGGVAYFINNYISIELNLGYFKDTFTTQNSNLNIDQEQKDSGFRSNIGFSIFL